MNHLDRSIDYLSSADTDAVYEFVLEHVPVTPGRYETLDDALKRTREEMRQFIRQRLSEIRPNPIIDGAVGRIRLTPRKGNSPHGTPYSADCFATCWRMLDNERAVQALNGTQFGTPAVRLNAKANGRCIAALDISRKLAELEPVHRQMRTDAALELDRQQERAEAALKNAQQKAAKELADARANAAARECQLLKQHAAQLSEARQATREKDDLFRCESESGE